MTLTRRQRQILREVCALDATYDEAGARLGIGGETVRTHLRRVYARLRVRGIGAACYRYCLEVDPEEDAIPVLRPDEV
jgi:DNA-binding CsgD family transcriptional regulator